MAERSRTEVVEGAPLRSLGSLPAGLLEVLLLLPLARSVVALGAKVSCVVECS